MQGLRRRERLLQVSKCALQPIRALLASLLPSFAPLSLKIVVLLGLGWALFLFYENGALGPHSLTHNDPHTLHVFPPSKAYQLVSDMGPEVLGGKPALARSAEALLRELLSSSSSLSANSSDEAMAWAALRPLREEAAALALLLEGYTHPPSVPAFLRACDGGSGPSLRAALRLVMRPLLHDVFAVKSLDEALSCLHWGPRDVSVFVYLCVCVWGMLGC